MSRLSAAVLGLLIAGLTAHALNLHGSSIHLASAAAVIGLTMASFNRAQW